MSNINKKSMIEYIIIIMCIICSGAVIFQNNNKIILLATTFILGLLFFLKKDRSISPICMKFFISYVVLQLFCCVIYLFNPNHDLLSEIGTILYFIIALLACVLLDKDVFFEKYNKILFLLAITSIGFYLIPYIYKEFPKYFSIIHDYAGAQFHNAWLYCYPTFIGSYYRNQSIFWESGAFQAFLNLALFLELYIVKRPIKKAYVVVYLITLLLTKSTTGYVLALFICGFKFLNFKFLKRKHITKKTVIHISIGVILVVLFFALGYGRVIFDKFSPESKTYFSFVRRTTDSLVDIKIVFDSWKNFLVGEGEKEYINSFTESLKQERNRYKWTKIFVF